MVVSKVNESEFVVYVCCMLFSVIAGKYTQTAGYDLSFSLNLSSKR